MPIRRPLFVLALACLGCGDGGPHLEARRDDAYQPIAVDSYRIEGARDGATTRATATLTLADGARLELRLDLFYDPTPILQAGRWRLEGPQPGSGDVVAENLRFAGGQGEGPSVGGRFRLEESGQVRFRVDLPLEPIQSAGWLD